MEMFLALKKPPLYSQYRRDAETPVFVSQYSVMLSRTCTPCDRLATSSLLGERVAAMRRRRSAIASSGMSTRKGRMSVSLDMGLHLPGLVDDDGRPDGS